MDYVPRMETQEGNQMKHYNPTLSEDMQRIFNIKSGENTDQVAEFIQPTKEILRKANIVRSASAASTIWTTPSDKDFYLTGLNVCSSHAALDTGTAVSITLFVDGVSRSIVQLTGINGANPAEQSISHDFTHPVKVDRNTAITLNQAGAFTAVRAVIIGYTEEVTKGV